MQTTNDVGPRRFSIPPWNIVIIQCVWVLTLVLAIRTGLATSEVWHFLIGGLLSPVVIVGLYCRWQWSLWVSAAFFAAALGGTMAHRVASLGDGIGSQQADFLFFIALIVQAGGWFIHQIPGSFRWLGIERVRPTRLKLLMLSFLAFCLWAFLVHRGLTQPATLD